MTHITKERAKCPHCFDIGYDASGYACTCIDTPAQIAPIAHIVGEIDHAGKVWTPAAPVQPVAWRYSDARGHYRYRGYIPGFDAEYQLLKPEALCLCATTPPAAQPAPCTWTQSADPNMPDTYEATCGAVWTFTESGPAENNMRFCPECGKKVTKGGSA